MKENSLHLIGMHLSNPSSVWPFRVIPFLPSEDLIRFVGGTMFDAIQK